MVSAEAYSPGHITAFFEIDTNSPHLHKKGSKGVGICTKKGAIAETIIQPARTQKIEIFINDRKEPAEVTEAAVKYLLNKEKYKVKINIKSELPVSQGCGMSAAGTLSTTIAISSLLGYTYNDALLASHRAEIELRGGLGDVIGESIGGVTVLLEGGLPVHNSYKKLLFSGDIVLCTLGDPIKTKNILSSRSMKNKINKWGKYAMTEFSKKMDMESLFREAKEFSSRINMMDKHMEAAINAVWKNGGMASVAMIGRSVFAYGKTSKIVDILSQYGDVKVTKIAQYGANLTSSITKS